ncbi:hypothetical protein GGI07_001647 [Coemansia sp. Benny D115]|nr:hypothetical protein GGI07_001647 [Coemansia sp. Benny D115]
MAMPFISPGSYARPKENRPHRFAYDFGSVDPGMFTPAPERSIPKRAPKRTISYTIPLPEDSSQTTSQLPDELQPPGHVLGVNALALSLNHTASTDSSLSSNIGGVLFSGGRDGVVKAWDLHFPFKRVSDSGDSHADTVGCASWVIDRHGVRQRRPRTTLRASQLVHSDWVNDLVVVNDGQTVVSASSDQTVRAWTPGVEGSRPQAVGSHLDYVKALAYSEHRQMVVSGGLDRKIKLWDIGQGRGPHNGPIAALQEFGDASVSSSVYALACNTQGSLVVSGSPEKVIRVWDTRAARQLTTLSGHTDHIRAILLSSDSELVLSGSSDTTVKLWSMRMRRCLSTFAQHNASVWSLHSSHPRFQTFHSASRDGLITKTIGAGVFAEEAHNPARRMSLTPGVRTASIDEAVTGVVCVAVAKEAQGVVKLVAADDTYIWTATKGITLNRWLDVNIRSPRKASSPARQSAHSNVAGGSVSHADGIARADSDDDNGDDNDDSEAKSGKQIRQSLIEPSWQPFHVAKPDKNLSNSNDTRQQQQNSSTSTNHHRRNRTIDYSGLQSQSPALSPRLGYLSPPGGTMSPVLKAIQAEQARRSSIKEVDDEDQYPDTRSSCLKTSTVSHTSHSRSQSAGSPSQKVRQISSITSVLASGDRESTPTEPNASSIDVADTDAMSIPESPLPIGAFLEATAAHSAAGSPAAVATTHASSSSYLSTFAASVNPNEATAATDKASADAQNNGVVPVRSVPDETIHGKHGLHRHKVLDNRRQVLAQDTRGRISLWDIMLCRRLHEFPVTESEAATSDMFPGVFGTDFEAIQMAISREPESVSSWCHVDTRTGALTVHLNETQVWCAEVHIDEVADVSSDVIQAMGEHERINIGQWMLKRLFLSYARSRVKRGPISHHDAMLLNRWAAQIPAAAIISSRPASQNMLQPQLQQALQQAREQSKGTMPLLPRSSTGTNTASKLSSLSPHIPSQSAVGTPPQLTVGNAENTALMNGELDHAQPVRQGSPSMASQLYGSSKLIGILPPTPPLPAKILISDGTESANGDTSLSSFAQGEDGDSDSESQGTKSRVSQSTSSGSQPSGANGSDPGFLLPHMSRQTSNPPRPVGSPEHKHNLSIDAAPNTAQQQQQQQQANSNLAKADDGESAASNGTSGKFMNRLLSMRIRRQKSTPVAQGNQASAVPTNTGNSGAAVPTTSSGSGGSSTLAVPVLPPNNRTKSTPDNANGSEAPGNTQDGGPRAPDLPPKHPERDEFAEWAGPRFPTDTERTLALLQVPPTPWEQLYSPIVCPRLPLPRNIVVQLYQDHYDASEPYSIYRNTIAAISNPVQDDVSMLPASYQEPTKVSFVLSPLPTATLPPFPNPNARLVANRMLRARKLAIYVVDKLGLPLMQQPAPNYINAVEACVRTYSRLAVNEGTKKAAGKNDQLPPTGNKYIDLFVAAGETLTDIERAALADMLSWQQIMERKNAAAGSSGGGVGIGIGIGIGATGGKSETNSNNSLASIAHIKKQDYSDDLMLSYAGSPELYLDLYCKGKKLPSKYTLATIKTSIWKSSGDIQVHYDWAEFIKKRIAKAQSLAMQLQK